MRSGARRAAAAAAVTLLASAAIAAGCGSGGSVTKAQALSYAEQAGLQPGDVPSDRAIGRAGPFDGVALGGVLNRCGAALPQSSERAVAISPTFVRVAPGAGLYPAYQKARLYSVVYVLDSEATAKRAIGALSAPRTPTCVAAVYRSSHPRGVAGLSVTHVALHLPAGTAEGIRETGAVALSSRPGTPRSHFVVDTFAFQTGAAVVRLTASGSLGASTAEERQLIELLLRRSRRLRL